MSGTRSPGESAIARADIADVFLVSAICKADFDLNQTALPVDSHARHRVEVSNEVHTQIRTTATEPPATLHILRYLVKIKVEFVKAGIPPTAEQLAVDRDLPEADVQGSIELIFAVDYRCEESLFADHPAIQSFSKNVAFHAWPYMREAVMTLSNRMRLPNFALPMLKPALQPAPATPADPARD